MTLYGPSDRTIEIDDTVPTLVDWTTLITEADGLGAIEQVVQELTGPGHTEPIHSLTGFKRAEDITLVFQADVGGSPDPVAEFYKDQSGERTFKVTFGASWDFQVEALITSSGPPDLPNEEHTLLEVVFRPTGSWTIN